MPDSGRKTAGLVLRQYLCGVFCLDTEQVGASKSYLLHAGCRIMAQ